MNYACFNCWATNDENEEKCLECGKELKYPLTSFPENVGEFTIEKGLGRGFYGVTYIAKNLLDQDVVLKITPQKLYRDKGKNFVDECKLHADISKGTNHLLKIQTILTDQEISFGDINRTCDIAVLDYIEGKTLKELIENKEELKIETIVQITIDLLELLQELNNKKIHHNDLHPANIIVEDLNEELFKYKNIDKSIHVVAIDLGSISEISKSVDDRKNDVHHIANYIHSLSEYILQNPLINSRKDFRIALELDRISKLLMPTVENNRIPSYEEIIDQVENAYKHESNPWQEEKLELKNIGQFYNAQNLLSWNVPDLFVEEDQWLNDVSSQGPLVITGMRGCGKTMLLKSMQIHARIKHAHNLMQKTRFTPLEQIKEDGFLGVFISSNRLLDQPGNIDSVYEPLTKLFLAYGIEVILALRHMQEEDYNDVQDDFYKPLLEEYELYFPELKTQKIKSDVDLEIALHNILALSSMGDKKYKLPNPITLFSKLARTIKKLSKTLSNSYILFLLDDISTRYLSTQIISELLSSLIFQDEHCAFKFTSEEQTMHSLIFSPGLIEKAKIGRDIEVFDLGTKVYQKTKGVAGKKFALKILEKRKEHASHPNVKPEVILGDKSLKEIACDIVQLENKNEIYHGLSALTGVCVGDIGDIILLYKNILEKRKDDKFPVPAKIQNLCFLELSNIRIHDLKKREKELENYAFSFAEAANSLLKDSYKKDPDHLRVYNSIYISNTSANAEKHYEKIRELVDAGVFVLLKSENLRMSGSGNNPINQFILLYRKILGITKPIGLSQNDRFELKGKNLDDWLKIPKDGARILKSSVEKVYRKPHPESLDIDQVEEEVVRKRIIIKRQKEIKEKTLLDLIDEPRDFIDMASNTIDDKYLSTMLPQISEHSLKNISQDKYDIYITTLGFEERTFESIKRILDKLKFKKIILIEYPQSIGCAKEILNFIKELKVDYEIIQENELNKLTAQINENILLDITGMSKSLIFKITQELIRKNKKMCVIHTSAKNYAPKEESLKPFYEDLKQSENTIDILEKITEKVSKGEELTEVTLSNLITSYTDSSKNRVLMATCNVKYEKLFQLINERDFDSIDLFVSHKTEIKNNIAKAAAKVIKIRYPEVSINSEDIHSLADIVKSLTQKYIYYFIDQGSNIEFGLTGNKIDTLAYGIIASKFQISDCWYLRTSEFDSEEFSEGVSDTKFYEISIEES